MYFINESLHLVTDAQMHNPLAQSKMAKVVDCFQEILQKIPVALPSDYEVYLLPEGQDRCGYYFIDHVNQVQFWIENVESSDLGLPPATSLYHLSKSNSNGWNIVNKHLMHMSRMGPSRTLLESHGILPSSYCPTRAQA